MKTTRYWLIAGITLLMVSATLFLASPKAVNAQQCEIVRIYATFQPQPSTRLEPETLSIDKGGCIVWLNWGRDKVKVNFRAGKECQAVTEAPTGFKFDKTQDCYVTDFLSLGGTSSLKFNDSGTYKYEVTWEGKQGVVQKGKVIVRAPEEKKQE